MAPVVGRVKGMAPFQHSRGGNLNEGAGVVRAAHTRGRVQQAIRTLGQAINPDSRVEGCVEGVDNAVSASVRVPVNRGVTQRVEVAGGRAVIVAVARLNRRPVRILAVAAPAEIAEDGARFRRWVIL